METGCIFDDMINKYFSETVQLTYEIDQETGRLHRISRDKRYPSKFSGCSIRKYLIWGKNKKLIIIFKDKGEGFDYDAIFD